MAPARAPCGDKPARFAGMHGRKTARPATCPLWPEPLFGRDRPFPLLQKDRK